MTCSVGSSPLRLAMHLWQIIFSSLMTFVMFFIFLVRCFSYVFPVYLDAPFGFLWISTTYQKENLLISLKISFFFFVGCERFSSWKTNAIAPWQPANQINIYKYKKTTIMSCEWGWWQQEGWETGSGVGEERPETNGPYHLGYLCIFKCLTGWVWFCYFTLFWLCHWRFPVLSWDELDWNESYETEIWVVWKIGEIFMRFC